MNPDGLLKTLGVEVANASADEVVLRLRVDDRHVQPFGIVHGGIHCTLVETAASIGAWYAVDQQKQVVGAENHTSFLKPAHIGAELTARAQPVSIGRRAHLWQVEVRDEADKLLASGRVRMFVL